MLDGNTVTEQDLADATKEVLYDVLSDGKTTICTIVMHNGFSVRDESSCVDPQNFNAAEGQERAYAKTLVKLRYALAVLLAEKLYAGGHLSDSAVQAAAREVLKTENERLRTKRLYQDADRARIDAGGKLRKLAGDTPVVCDDVMLAPGGTEWNVSITPVIR